MLRIREIENLESVFKYQMSFYSPYFFLTDFDTWETSFVNDVDGEGRILFKELYVKASYDEEELVGFIQYGKTAFGFDNNGEITSEVSYPVIRNFYFDKNRADAGSLLLREALKEFGTTDNVYGFFHYFGMSCFARHGKLFEQHTHIEELMRKNGFKTEHENVYYSSILEESEESEVGIIPHNLTKGDQQYVDFVLSGNQVGGCEVHFVDDKTTYLRWIYVNENITGRGIGTKCMRALKQWLYQKGFRRFDTDTAKSNFTAQRYYEKNGFTHEGITKSYYWLKE